MARIMARIMARTSFISFNREASNLFSISFLVCNDKDTNQHKGPTVMTQMERVEAIQSCKYVDQGNHPFPIS